MKYPELLADNRSTLEKSVAQLVVVRIDEDPQWSGQKRPCVVTSKPAICSGPRRSSYLSRFLLIRQVGFGSPASRSTFEDMAVVK